jgi:hypothetical protein
MPMNQRTMKLSSILGVTVATFLLDWFYLSYITAHGFDLKIQQFVVAGFGFSMPLQWLPIIGVMFVSLVTWYEVFARIFPRRGATEFDPLANLRLIRVIVLSLGLFLCVLYIPYLIGSNWFWARLSDASKSVTQLGGFGLSLLNTDESAMGLNPLWQYSLTQVLATGALVFGAWAFGRVPRRPRKPR